LVIALTPTAGGHSHGATELSLHLSGHRSTRGGAARSPTIGPMAGLPPQPLRGAAQIVSGENNRNPGSTSVVPDPGMRPTPLPRYKTPPPCYPAQALPRNGADAKIPLLYKTAGPLAERAGDPGVRAPGDLSQPMEPIGSPASSDRIGLADTAHPSRGCPPIHLALTPFPAPGATPHVPGVRGPGFASQTCPGPHRGWPIYSTHPSRS
jgi:hypothetical protein